MKHTKGSWKLDWLKNGGCNISPEDGHGRIATIWVRRSKTDNLAEIEANAHLIAAAPDLLEACKALLSVTQYQSEYSIEEKILAETLAEQTIAKAERRE